MAGENETRPPTRQGKGNGGTTNQTTDAKSAANQWNRGRERRPETRSNNNTTGETRGHKKMQIIKSTIKIAENYFNNCPGRNDIIREIDKMGLAPRIEYCDIISDKPNWKNDLDTLTFRVKGPQRFEIGLLIGELSARINADEFNYFRVTDADIVIRFWWD